MAGGKDDSINPIDLDGLESHLRNAIEEDEKYKREDAAKFRAIEQSRTYEEFRNIVKASHLKPLNKHESLTSKNIRPAVWNRFVPGMKSPPNSERVSSSVTHSCHRVMIDEMLLNELSFHNFQQLWFLLFDDRERRMNMLMKAVSQGNIFQDHAIPVDLMVGIVETLNDSLSEKYEIAEETFYLAIAVMRSIVSSPRFDLHVLFLSEQERNIIRQLKEKLKTCLNKKGKQKESGGSVNMSLTFLDNF